MRIFITGGNGFVGQHLISRLIKDGHELNILVRSKNTHNIPANKNLNFFEGDILDYDSLKKAINGCQQVYHLAACTAIWVKDPKQYYRVNVIGTNNVLDAAIETNVDKVVVTSTAGVFGPSIDGVINESSPRLIEYFNEYESSKAISESMIKNYVIEKKMNVVIVNPTRIYGPHINTPIGSFTQMIYRYNIGKWRLIPGDGTKIGNYIYIDDVIEGHLKAMEKGLKGNNYLLSGENFSYNDFFKELKTTSKKEYRLFHVPMFIQLVYGRIQLFKRILFSSKPTITPKWIKRGNYNWEVSNQRIQEELGVEITSLKDGLHKTIYWLNNRNK